MIARSGRGSTGDAVDRLTQLALDGGRGDRAAMGAFVTLAMDDVWRYCAATIGANRADDAVQETFIRAMRSLPRFRGDASARTWLLKIARFVCVDDIRARTRQQRIVDRLSAQPFDDEAPTDRHPPELMEALGLLSTDRREAFVLTQVMGMPYQEAAELVDCPIGTIRSRVARARAELMELLDVPEEDLSADLWT